MSEHTPEQPTQPEAPATPPAAAEPATAPAAQAAGGNGAILEVNDIHTYYGSIHALKGISLEVREGEIVTLIGANGAGKSTTLRSINGLNRPRKGHDPLPGQGHHGRGSAQHRRAWASPSPRRAASSSRT